MTPAQASAHFQYACRATVLICANFIMGFLIGYWVSDREVEP